jgi:hypothetical protein
MATLQTWSECGDNRTMHNCVARTLTIVVAWVAMATVPASLAAQGLPDTIAQHLIALEH